MIWVAPCKSNLKLGNQNKSNSFVKYVEFSENITNINDFSVITNIFIDYIKIN